MHKTTSIARQITSFTQKEIQHLFKISKYFLRIPEFDIRAAKSISSIGKILIITPKKIGNAPERNKLKRKIKALFYQDEIYSCQFDFIILCKVGSTTFTFEGIRDIFKTVLKKLEMQQNVIQ